MTFLPIAAFERLVMNLLSGWKPTQGFELALCLQDGSRHVNDYRLAVQKWMKQANKPQGRGRGRR